MRPVRTKVHTKAKGSRCRGYGNVIGPFGLISSDRAAGSLWPPQSDSLSRAIGSLTSSGHPQPAHNRTRPSASEMRVRQAKQVPTPPGYCPGFFSRTRFDWCGSRRPASRGRGATLVMSAGWARVVWPSRGRPRFRAAATRLRRRARVRARRGRASARGRFRRARVSALEACRSRARD
jgi:hypothetical protein